MNQKMSSALTSNCRLLLQRSFCCKIICLFVSICLSIAVVLTPILDSGLIRKSIPKFYSCDSVISERETKAKFDVPQLWGLLLKNTNTITTSALGFWKTLGRKLGLKNSKLPSRNFYNLLKIALRDKFQIAGYKINHFVLFRL